MFSIGITGHRALAAPQAISTCVDQALLQIAILHPPPWSVYSLLAEGSDRLVLERIFARYEAQLIVPLPLPEADYVKDFEGEASRREFSRWLSKASQVVRLDPAPRPQAYWSAGVYMLSHCSLMIAVWDGQKARGVGGTGEVVEEGRRREVPLAWIKVPAGSDDPVKLYFERF
jgi:hypothetical protein